MKKPKTQWIYIKVLEPYPVLGLGAKLGDDNPGPFYAAGSEFNFLYNEKNLIWCNQMLFSLRERGWTASLEVR